MKSTAKKFLMTFDHKEEIAPGIFSLYFIPPQDFSYEAGQYLQMTLPHKKPDAGGTSRFFTIASAPLEKYIMITSKKRQSTFKDSLFYLKKGEQIACFGPIGTFVLEENFRV